jgi:hypothetical protein
MLEFSPRQAFLIVVDFASIPLHARLNNRKVYQEN